MRDSQVGHRRSVPVYIGAGGIATASHYAVTIAAVELLGVPPLAATAAGFVVGSALKYWLNYSVAFRSRARHSHAMTRFVAASGVMLALNTALFASIQQGFGLQYVIAQVIT